MVELTLDRGVARVLLNRPEALNAWTEQLGAELLSVLGRVACDPEVRAIVLTGAGRAFSSGADLTASSLAGDGEPDVLTPLRALYNPLILAVRTLPKPVIAAVNGPAAGIGCSLALAADLIVAAESAYFLLSFVKLGLGLDGGASLTLPARVGHARAFEIAYLGERITAGQAQQWGLVNDVVPDAELDHAVAELTERLAAGPPGPTRTSSGRSTTASTKACPSCSSSRPCSSRSERSRATSRRACSRSPRSAWRDSRASDPGCRRLEAAAVRWTPSAAVR
ncbi:MAG: enoyl-CoA hydratase/isomerase family protein [Solirubrobacteraceae bacterium]